VTLASEPFVRIQICGALAVERDGERLDARLPGRQGRLLFTYLVVNRHRHILRDEVAEAVTPQCAGPDLVFGEKNAWGLGFGIDDDSNGMGGLGGNYGGFCPGGGYSVGFVTGSVGSFDRVEALENALRDCIGLPPLPA